MGMLSVVEAGQRQLPATAATAWHAARDCRQGEASKKGLFFKALLKAKAVMKSVRAKKYAIQSPEGR
jgi:hypothetical protein